MKKPPAYYIFGAMVVLTLAISVAEPCPLLFFILPLSIISFILMIVFFDEESISSIIYGRLSYFWSNGECALCNKSRYIMGKFCNSCFREKRDLMVRIMETSSSDEEISQQLKENNIPLPVELLKDDEVAHELAKRRVHVKKIKERDGD